MTDPGSELRDIFYSRAEKVDLSPALPDDVRGKVRRLRRVDALLIGIALLLAVAGTSAVVATFERSSLPPADPDTQGLEAAPFESPLRVGPTYRSAAFGGIRFTITDALEGNHVHIQTGRVLGLHTEGHNGLEVQRVTRVHDPRSGEKIPAPRELAGWLLSHPRIDAERVGTLSVDGERAVVLVLTDAKISTGEPCSEGLLERRPCLPLIASHQLGLYALADDLIRVYLFRHEGLRYSAGAYGTRGRPELAERWDAFMRSLDFED